MDKALEYYLNLPYTIELIPDFDDGGFVASIKELPGCLSQGDTAEEAVEMIYDAMGSWIEIALEDGDAIPEPRPEEDFSGKFVVRVSKSLHRRLVEQAETEDVSLNKYITQALSGAVHWPSSSPTKSSKLSSWPGLSEAAHHALIAAGMGLEAGESNERLFSEWADRMISNIWKAIDDGQAKHAKGYILVMNNILTQNTHRNPVLTNMSRLLRLLENFINPSTDLDLLKQQVENIEIQLSRAVRIQNREFHKGSVQKHRAIYSKATIFEQSAMEPSLAEGLFSFAEISDEESEW